MLHQMQRMMKNAAINTLNQDRKGFESIKQANTNAEVDQAATVAEKTSMLFKLM